MAEIYDKAGERLIITAVREAYIQPFDAPNWLDLRVGFFLSLTDNTADDTITGLSETIGMTAPGIHAWDRYWIGLKTNETAWPRATGVVFMGYSNTMHGAIGTGGVESIGSSVLSSTGAGIAAGVSHWWPNNSAHDYWSTIITDGPTGRAGGVQYLQQHFAQNATTTGGYATLLGLRFTRPNTGRGGTNITMSCKRVNGVYSSDILFSDTPTVDIIEENLQTFPTSTVSMGPVQLSRVPDALYFYWPFRGSRLRIHSIGILKYR